ncbi:unnamed protein product [Linum trigynum]|uniref:Plant thionin family protein n=1 Tax=Linum trigynum TaxID=586398 RepID=A0AAV2DN87_9ROSI
MGRISMVVFVVMMLLLAREDSTCSADPFLDCYDKCLDDCPPIVFETCIMPCLKKCAPHKVADQRQEIQGEIHKKNN